MFSGESSLAPSPHMLSQHLVHDPAEAAAELGALVAGDPRHDAAEAGPRLDALQQAVLRGLLVVGQLRGCDRQVQQALGHRGEVRVLCMH